MESSRNTPFFVLYSLVFISIASGIIMVLFPVHTTDTCWKEYRILAVSPPDHEQELVTRLSTAGIGHIVTESNSMLPRGNPLSPVQPFIDEANRLRSRWFYNPESGLRFFFVPDTPHLERVIESAFASQPVSWYLEGTASFFLLLLVPPLLLIAAGLFVQKNRLAGVLGSVPAVILAGTWNTMAGMTGASLIVCTVIALSDVLHEGSFELTGPQRVERVKRNPFLFSPVLVALVIALFNGGHSFALFFMAILATGSVFLLVYLVPAVPVFSEYLGLLHRRRFRCVPIHPHTLYRSGHVNRSMIVILAGVLILSGAPSAILSSTGSGKSSFSGEECLYLPIPAGYTDQVGFTPETFESFLRIRSDSELPDLADFLAVQWKMTIFPWTDYRNRLYPPAVGEQMVVYDYLFDEQQGRLLPMARVVAEFDREFIKKTLAGNTTPLEKMLLEQGRFVSGRITRHP